MKYGYKIPVNFFVIGVCSLGLQLYRDKIQGMTIVQPTIEVENGLKTSMFKWFKINFEFGSSQDKEAMFSINSTSS